MLRTAAVVLLLAWVLGSISGYAFGGAIHLLLLLGTLLFLVERRIATKKAKGQEVSTAGIFSIVMRRAQDDPGQAAHDRWSSPSR